MKIAFCGDSFAADITDSPYPTWQWLLNKEYKAEILCKGKYGISLFHSYEIMIENIEEADYLIFCITDASRLSNPFKLPITTQHAEDKNAFIDIVDNKRYTHSHGISNSRFDIKELQTAVKYYYKMLYDDSHMETTHRGLLREIESVVKKNNKKCIFLKSFEHSFCEYVPTYSVWGNLSLYENISMEEFKYMTKTQLDEINRGGDFRHNHLNEKNNYNMYLFLKNIIDKDDFTSSEKNMINYFSN